MFWEVLTANWPIAIVFVLAVIICGAELIKAIRIWREEKKNRINTEVAKVQKDQGIVKDIQEIKEEFKKMGSRLDNIDTKLQKNEQKMADLTQSDMHDIKSWIIEQHQHFYVELGWIDAYHMDIINIRYEDYQKEGGNSYIGDLVSRLRSLPTDPSLSLWKNGRNRDNEER